MGVYLSLLLSQARVPVEGDPGRHTGVVPLRISSFDANDANFSQFIFTKAAPAILTGWIHPHAFSESVLVCSYTVPIEVLDGSEVSTAQRALVQRDVVEVDHLRSGSGAGTIAPPSGGSFGPANW